MKDLISLIVGGAVLGVVSVLGCIVLFWAQGQTIEIGGKLLDWSWMGFPLGYGALAGATATLLLGLIAMRIIKRDNDQLVKDELLWEVATQEIRDANELIRNLEATQKKLEAENAQLQQNLAASQQDLAAADQLEQERADDATQDFVEKSQLLTTAEQDLDVARAEITRLEQELTAAQTTNSSVTRTQLELETANVRIAELEKDLADAQDN
jgi:hypothetical protein